MKTSGVGSSILKADAIAKVTGKALFAADLKRPGMVYAKVVRSETAHAVIDSIDVSEAAAFPGVVAVFTAKDVPGTNGVGMIIKDEPVLVGEKIRRYGDAIALVVAESEEIAIEAGKRIRLSLRELPAYFDTQSAMAADAIPIHGSSNVLTVRKIRKGDVEAAFAASAEFILFRKAPAFGRRAKIRP